MTCPICDRTYCDHTPAEKTASIESARRAVHDAAVLVTFARLVDTAHTMLADEYDSTLSEDVLLHTLEEDEAVTALAHLALERARRERRERIGGARD